jgi:hypothetical protein
MRNRPNDLIYSRNQWPKKDVENKDKNWRTLAAALTFNPKSSSVLKPHGYRSMLPVFFLWRKSDKDHRAMPNFLELF